MTTLIQNAETTLTGILSQKSIQKEALALNMGYDVIEGLDGSITVTEKRENLTVTASPLLLKAYFVESLDRSFKLAKTSKAKNLIFDTLQAGYTASSRYAEANKAEKSSSSVASSEHVQSAIEYVASEIYVALPAIPFASLKKVFKTLAIDDACDTLASAESGVKEIKLQLLSLELHVIEKVAKLVLSAEKLESYNQISDHEKQDAQALETLETAGFTDIRRTKSGFCAEVLPEFHKAAFSALAPAGFTITKATTVEEDWLIVLHKVEFKITTTVDELV